MVTPCLTLGVIGFSLAAVAATSLMPGRVRAAAVTSSTLNSIASALMIAAGTYALVEGGGTVVLLKHIPAPGYGLVLGYDWLTSILVIVLGFVSLTVSIYSARHYMAYGREGDVRGVASVLPIFTLSMFLVLTARNVLWFFIFWEVMTLSSLALILFEHGGRHVRFSGMLYAATMHVGALSLLVGLFLLVAEAPGHPMTYSALAASAHALAGNPLTYVALGLITAGFLFKAGVIPLHLWLPDAHSVAPSNASALFSGVMVKMGVYGVIRFALIILSPCVSGTYALILTGSAALSVAVGAAYAAVQSNYKRLLGFSTVENVGIIMLAVSAAALGLATGIRWLYCLGLAAALLHTVNHSIFKSLMFLNAGTVLRATGVRDLRFLGGLGRRLKVTAATALVGTLSASAMPPLNGFASKFVVYEVLLMAAATLTAWYLRLASLLATVALILSGVLTMLAFTKLYGSTFLGPETAGLVREGESAAESAAAIMLSTACVGTAFATPAILHAILTVMGGGGAALAGSYGGILLALGRGVWSVPAVASYVMLSVILGGAFGISLATYGRVRKGVLDPLVSGVPYSPEVHRPGPDTLTSLLRDYLGGLLGIRKSIGREYLVRHCSVGTLGYSVRYCRHLLDPALRLRDAGEFFERVFYAPPYRFFKWVGGWFKNLQGGNLLLYITYIYIAYLVLLGVVLWLR